jgi:hypothetical protein
VAGDEVLVASGVYSAYDTRMINTGGFVSSVGFLKAGVDLISEKGAAGTTLRIDVVTPHTPVILWFLGSPGDVEIDGFTFTGAAPHLSGLQFTFSGRCIVRNCIFRDIGTGLGDEFGAGSLSADLELYDCRFENST